MTTYHNSSFQPCAKRDRLTMIGRDGGRKPVHRCTETTAVNYFEIVSPVMCEGCPVRQTVTQVAIAKREYKPPLVEDHRAIRGRKTDAEVDGWQPCQDREIIEITSCCGMSVAIKMCNSVDCFRMGSEVSREMCRGCLNRRE